MASKKQLLFVRECTRKFGYTTHDYEQFWNSFPSLLEYLNFLTFYFFSINQKQNKKSTVN